MPAVTPQEPESGAAQECSLAFVKDVMRRAIEQTAGIPTQSIGDHSTLDGDLAMDSLSQLAFQAALECRLGVALDAGRLMAANRFDAIAQVILHELHSETSAR
jgi:acyl carrier protein